MSLSIRTTNINDTSTILFFIHKLAEYEQLQHEVIATEDDVRTSLFGTEPQAEALLAFEDNTPVGFALFFSNYSTFLGRSGIHLEDLFVLEEYRGRGYGKALLEKVQVIAQVRGAGRLEWNCWTGTRLPLSSMSRWGPNPCLDGPPIG